MTRNPAEVRATILAWIVANLLGVTAVGALSLIPFLTSIPGILVSSLLIGLPIGFAQLMALRRVAPISTLWVLTISAGLLMGLVVTPILAGIWGFVDNESVVSLTADYMTIGLLVGLAQWALLRGHFDKSFLWLLSSAAGLGLGIALVLISSLIYQSGILSIVLVAVVYAVATGVVISWLPASHSKTEGRLVNAP
jgi:hypothetical protein